MLWFPRSSKVKKYKEIREISRALVSEIIHVVPKEVLIRVAKDMRILRKGIFVFDSEEEMSFIQDRAIFDVPWGGKTAIEHFEAERGDDLSAEEKVHIEAMKKAYFSLFEVTGNATRESLQLSDLLLGDQIELTDISLSATASKGSLLASRVVKIEDICMTTGAIYPFLPEQKDVLISGLEKQRGSQRSRRGRSARRTGFSDPRNYSLYFFRQYKRLSPIEVRMLDELSE